MRRIAIAAAVFGVLGCGPSQPPTVQQAPPTVKAPPDLWLRTKECADQADRVAARNRWNEDSHQSSTVPAGWFNHYNAKLQRCFMRLDYLNREFKSNHLPYTYYEMYDAFENRRVAVCTDSPMENSGTFCDIGDTPTPCPQCRSFVRDSMAN